MSKSKRDCPTNATTSPSDNDDAPGQVCRHFRRHIIDADYRFPERGRLRSVVVRPAAEQVVGPPSEPPPRGGGRTRLWPISGA
jgi:hypothetical protein